MSPITEKLVNQHRQYLSEHPKELEKYATLYQHMLFFFTNILGIEEEQAVNHISDFKADMSCDLLKNVDSSEII
ncbi:hypothetical protein ACFQZT_11555 [Paenibacillus sp. GCM10027628]|uniref:hypothetical protein n=1 Tax=Paenibacillus sp. GCM10027628 TaxID=3273413 RepID=UPI00363DD416